MDFSLTEQQVPMLMRLIYLALALHSKELNKKKNQQSNALTDQIPPDADPVDGKSIANNAYTSNLAKLIK